MQTSVLTSQGLSTRFDRSREDGRHQARRVLYGLYTLSRQHNTIQYNTIQYNTIQYNIITFPNSPPRGNWVSAPIQ